MIPNTSVNPAASKNSSRPNCRPFKNCSTISSMSPTTALQQNRGSDGPPLTSPRKKKKGRGPRPPPPPPGGEEDKAKAQRGLGGRGLSAHSDSRINPSPG